MFPMIHRKYRLNRRRNIGPRILPETTDCPALCFTSAGGETERTRVAHHDSDYFNTGKMFSRGQDYRYIKKWGKWMSVDGVLQNRVSKRIEITESNWKFYNLIMSIELKKSNEVPEKIMCCTYELFDDRCHPRDRWLSILNFHRELYSCLHCEKLYCKDCLPRTRHVCVCTVCHFEPNFDKPFNKSGGRQLSFIVNGGEDFTCDKECALKCEPRKVDQITGRHFKSIKNTEQDRKRRGCVRLHSLVEPLLIHRFQQIYCYDSHRPPAYPEPIDGMTTRVKGRQFRKKLSMCISLSLLLNTRIFEKNSPNNRLVITFLGAEGLDELPIKLVVPDTLMNDYPHNPEKTYPYERYYSLGTFNHPDYNIYKCIRVNGFTNLWEKRGDREIGLVDCVFRPSKILSPQSHFNQSYDMPFLFIQTGLRVDAASRRRVSSPSISSSVSFSM